MFTPRFMPCPECGESVDRASAVAHSCADERRVDYEMVQLADEVAGLEEGLHRYLETPPGRFETWLAAMQVRASR